MPSTQDKAVQAKMKRPYRREAKSARRAQLQATALELVDQHGYDAVTVRQIAEAAGVTERTFFRVFPTKDSALLWYFDDDTLPELDPENRDYRAIAEGDARYVIHEESDRRLLLRRLRIIARTPALRSQWIYKNHARAAAVARLYCDAHREKGALDVRVQMTAIYSAAAVVAETWALRGGSRSLDSMLDHAFALARPSGSAD
jgi:AcrR family transcriptional regulator